MTGALFIPALYFFCFAVLLGLAVFIYRRDPQAWLNRYFALFALSILGWLVTLFAFNRQGDTPFLTNLGRLNFAVAAGIVLFGYLFVREVTRHRSGRRGTRLPLWLGLETAALAAVTLFTGLLDTSEHLSGTQHVTVFGPLFPLFILHIGGYILAALYLAFVSGHHATPKVRGQLSIIGLGIFVMAAIAVVTNLLLPYLYGNFAFQEIGALSTLALLSAIAYAISVHQLFDIRVFIRRAFIFALLLAFTSAAYNGVLFALAVLFRGGFADYDWHDSIPSILIFSVLGFAFEPLRTRLDLSISRVLYRQEQERQEALRLLAQNLNGALTLDEALEMAMHTLMKKAGLRHAVTYIFQAGDGGRPAIKHAKQAGYRHPENLLLKNDDPAIDYFTHHSEILNLEALEAILAEEESIIQAHEQKGSKHPRLTHPRLASIPNWSAFVREHNQKRAVQKALTSLHAAIAVPLFLDEQPLGVILLGRKSGDSPYTPEDEWLLETVAAHAVSSIQKAKLYESDQTKSEFVSIASHELLTPITAIEGFLSMILDEGMGKVDDQARGYLNNVYASARRLSVLVKDLLSVSRIESGKIEIQPQQVDLEKLIADAVAQLQFKAKDKHLKLNFTPPSAEQPPRLLPPVWADPGRTMEVLMNLVGNAIKYTPEGSVTITMQLQDKSVPCVRVDVADTGLGMTKEAQSHLFQKFYRVKTDETAGIQGTGLGLYITKAIIEKMDGELALHSVPGKGSTFSFTLPLFQVENVGREPGR